MVLGEQVGSLAQGLQQMFRKLMEGRFENTNYIVVIVTASGHETQSCVVVTGGSLFSTKNCKNKKIDIKHRRLLLVQVNTSVEPWPKICSLPMRV